MNKPKIIKKKNVKPAHPLYDAFTLQVGAAVKLARQIDADKSFSVPDCVRRFLDEFGRKSVVK